MEDKSEMKELVKELFNKICTKVSQIVNLLYRVQVIYNSIMECNRETLKDLHTSLSRFQCKIIICRRYRQRACYFYHTVKKDTSLSIIIKYFCCTLVMKYVSVCENLKNVKEIDSTNFRKLFEQLKYKTIFNQSPKMTKQNNQSFLAKVVANYELHENTHKYDGLITVGCKEN
ncbi:hypothetical protein RFI_36465 [Reticulomyxa filosa]|uniref:Uncharacterized protein n=1 Tax=Reticulomyxa filosa TaxID=46433 RepID=X6LJT4_RETFI|nr:hypothetical protein RFI_36465 [Reticulomyxa filosa]|eukprot:ETO00975.1 hypothetical protein RFI_36465 [Reticulomyxa filosa]